MGQVSDLSLTWPFGGLSESIRFVQRGSRLLPGAFTSAGGAFHEAGQAERASIAGKVNAPLWGRLIPAQGRALVHGAGGIPSEQVDDPRRPGLSPADLPRILDAGRYRSSVDHAGSHPHLPTLAFLAQLALLPDPEIGKPHLPLLARL